MSIWGFDDGRDSKRGLTQREKQFLYENAKGRCENPKCKRKITFFEMQVGHKRAWSRGGSTTLKNSVCLCYKCNHDQGTDSWEVFLRKQGVEDTRMKVKRFLDNLTLSQLKLVAAKHNVRVSGYVEESLFSSRRIAPGRQQYVSKLSRVLKEEDLKVPRKPAAKPKRKTRKKSDSWW